MAVAVTKKGVASLRTQYEPGHKDTPILEVVNVVLDAATGVIALATDCDVVREVLGVALGVKLTGSEDCWAVVSTTTTPNDTITINGASTDDVDVFIFGKA